MRTGTTRRARSRRDAPRSAASPCSGVRARPPTSSVALPPASRAAVLRRPRERNSFRDPHCHEGCPARSSRAAVSPDRPPCVYVLPTAFRLNPEGSNPNTLLTVRSGGDPCGPVLPVRKLLRAPATRLPVPEGAANPQRKPEPASPPGRIRIDVRSRRIHALRRRSSLFRSTTAIPSPLDY